MLWVYLALGAVTLSLFLFYSTPFQNFIDLANAWAMGLMNEHPVWGAAVFFLFSALSAMLAFASSTILVPSAILAWGKPVTFLLLWGGWFAGAVVAYGIGRLARPLLNALTSQATIDEYEQFISTRTKFWAVLLFCVAVPSEIPGYLLGGMRYPLLKFAAAMAMVEAAYAWGVIIAGENLVATRFSTFLVTLGILILITLSAGLLLRIFKKRKKGGIGGTR